MACTGWTSTCALALISVGLLACGSVSNPGGGDDEPGDFTITANPASLTIPIAGSDTVTVTVQRTGSVGDVMLGATGLGANLTATFSPNPVPAGSTTSTATISVAGGSAPGTTNFTVTGSAGATQRTAMVSVTSTTITVTGTIRGNRSGVKVGIIGKQSVTSGAGGVFMFTDVTPPYDLYTFVDVGTAASPLPTVFYFDNLTRPDPIVSAATPASLIIRQICRLICPGADIKGTKTGAGTNTDPVVFAWTDGSIEATLSAGGTYTGRITWDSGDRVRGFLHALQFTRRQSGAPNTFLGYVKTTELTVDANSSASVDLNFTPVTSTAMLTGIVNGPGGDYEPPSITLFQQFGDTQETLWTTKSTTTVDATFPLIAAAGGTALFAQASNTTGTSSFIQPLTGNVAVNFTMPAAAVLDLPADAATGVTTSTHFTWTSAASTINELNISTNGTNRAAFKIFTTASDVTIPVVPELTLPANQSFSWRVLGYGPNTSINEAAASSELETVTTNDYQGPPHALTFTPFRNFTSAP